MSRIDEVREHERLVERYNRQEIWRATNYKGYQTGDFLHQFAWRDDVYNTILDIKYNRESTIAKKNAILRDLTKKGKQRMIEMDTGNLRYRWVSERIIKEADIAQSKANYENYKLVQAIVDLKNIYKTRNKQGDPVYISRDLENNEYAIDKPTLVGLMMSRTLQLKGTNIILGERVPSALKTQDKIDEYQKYVHGFLSNLSMTPRVILSNINALPRYGSLFKGGPKVSRKQRLPYLKENMLSAMFGGNSFYYQTMNAKGTDVKKSQMLMRRVKNKFSRISKMDALYLTIVREDLFSMENLYDVTDFVDVMTKIDTVIDGLNNMKKDIVTKKRNNDESYTIEEQAYLQFKEHIGSFYD